jgi:hypothetical protein
MTWSASSVGSDSNHRSDRSADCQPLALTFAWRIGWSRIQTSCGDLARILRGSTNMDETSPWTPEQQAALVAVGLGEEQIARFRQGEAVAYLLATETEPGIAILQRVGSRLRSGIVEVNDPGGGVKTLARFRGQARRIAASFGLTELELFGAEVINQKLSELLLNQGFERKTEPCPEALGGGEMTILSRVFPVV